MKNRLFQAAWLVAALPFASLHSDRAAGDERKPVYCVRAAIHRITASVSGTTSLTEDLGMREEGRPVGAKSGPFTFFTMADLQIGRIQFRMDEKGATWNGRARPPACPEATTLAEPTLTTLAGQKATIFVGSDQPLQYFGRLDDGRFELRSLSARTGLTLTEAVADEGETLLLSPFELSIDAAGEREPIPGVELDVGKPIISSERAAFILRVKPGRPYAVQWQARQGILLLVFTVTRG
jgi:hypothetical protein